MDTDPPAVPKELNRLPTAPRVATGIWNASCVNQTIKIKLVNCNTIKTLTCYTRKKKNQAIAYKTQK